jgi:hypothetical protein
MMKAPRCSLVAAVLGLLAGCASSPLPPELTEAQGRRLSELPLPYSVGVAPYKYPIYSEKLTLALAASGAFSRVAPLEQFASPPDLIATVEESIHGTATIPAATIATAGVVPTTVTENHGFVFSLAPSSRRTRKTMVDASYSGTTTLGWGALAVNASSDYTRSDPEQSERFRRMLAHRTLVALRPARGRTADP